MTTGLYLVGGVRGGYRVQFEVAEAMEMALVSPRFTCYAVHPVTYLTNVYNSRAFTFVRYVIGCTE
jgi:hypothetical protein